MTTFISRNCAILPLACALGVLAGCTAPAPAPAVGPAPALAPVAGTASAASLLPGGRVIRSYHAASGRDCREVATGAGLEERARVFCQQDGQWVAARPLLGGAR